MFSNLNKLLQGLLRKKQPSTHDAQASERDQKKRHPRASDTAAVRRTSNQKTATPKPKRKSASGKPNKRRKTSGKNRSKTTKQGLKVLTAKDDLYSLFGPEGTEHRLETEPEKTVSKSAERPVLKKIKSPEDAAAQPRIKTFNKNGLPVFDSKADLDHLFGTASNASEIEGGEADFSNGSLSSPRQTEKTKTALGNRAKKKPPYPTDKHGLPILNDRTDLWRVFKTDAQETALDIRPGEKSKLRTAETSRENFARMLEDSLTGKNQQALLREKKDNLHRRKPLSVKQRIKRYPPPQGQLDLHGYTSYRAEEKVDSYIRDAYQREIFTLRLIVGKGLHSENGPVLPDVVEDKLIELKQQRIVLAYQWEKKSKAKSGAVIVYLAIYN